MGKTALNHAWGKTSNIMALTSNAGRRLLQHQGLQGTLYAVHHHLKTAKPALLLLTETQILSLADISYFT